MNLLVVPQYCPSPPQFAVLGVGEGSLHYHVSLSLAILCVVSRSYVVQKPFCQLQFFFRRNCSVNRCRLVVSVEEVSLGSS